MLRISDAVVEANALLPLEQNIRLPVPFATAVSPSAALPPVSLPVFHGQKLPSFFFVLPAIILLVTGWT